MVFSIDNLISPKPTFFMVNCVHPTSFNQAIHTDPNTKDLVRTRLKGIQANGSSKSPEELELFDKLDSENPKIWSKKILDLYLNSDMQILGVCCGTNHRHVSSIAKYYRKIK